MISEIDTALSSAIAAINTEDSSSISYTTRPFWDMNQIDSPSYPLLLFVIPVSVLTTFTQFGLPKNRYKLELYFLTRGLLNDDSIEVKKQHADDMNDLKKKLINKLLAGGDMLEIFAINTEDVYNFMDSNLDGVQFIIDATFKVDC